MQNLEFSTMPLSSQMLQSLQAMGYTTATPIQSEVIPHLLNAETLDLVALAQTGSGKTAAFGVPLLEKIDGSKNEIQGLVLAPTRELAAQIDDIISKLMKPMGLRSMTVYGGQSYNIQRDNLRRKPHVLIATPGRLVDLLSQNLIDLTQLKVLVLDEADRMLSMGFEEDLQTILSHTHQQDGEHERASCQTWLFSATMAPGVKRILNRYLHNPKIVEQVSGNQGVSATLKHHYVAVRSGFRKQALLRIVKSIDNFYGIIFCQTKRDVSALEEILRDNDISCMSLHGDKQQRERESILKSLKSEKFNILIATDVAARGLDVKNLTHVIHYSLPIEIESYIHRSGRTGRNGEEGLVISIMEPSEFSKLNRIQRLTKIQFTPYEMKNTGEVLKGIVKSELESLSHHKGDSHIMQELKKICGELLTEQETDLYSTAEWMAAVINSKMRDQSIWRDDIYIHDFAARSGGGKGERRGDRGGDFRREGRRGEDRRDFRSDRRGGDFKPRRDRGDRFEARGEDRGEARDQYRGEARGQAHGEARDQYRSEARGEGRRRERYESAGDRRPSSGFKKTGKSFNGKKSFGKKKH
jgi:ATP-dependent RNA helicase DeaD